MGLDGLAAYSSAYHMAALVARVIYATAMHRAAAIFPNQCVTEPPLMLPLKFRPINPVVLFRQQLVAIHLLNAKNSDCD